MAILLASLVGVPLGIRLGASEFRGRSILVALVYTGMCFPPVVIGLLVYMLLSRSGPLAALGWLYRPQAMIVAQTCIAFPIVVGLVMMAVEAVPAELVRQLRSLGATRSQEWRAILWEARFGVLYAILAAFGRIISEVGAALLVGGNIAGQTRVLTTAILLETSQGEFGMALALGGWLVSLALVVNLSAMRLHRRWVS
jgi:tungstate transport system permease protein